MDSSSEAMELRRELEAVRSALQQQSESVIKQRHQLVEAGQALASRSQRAVRERRLRQDQLALVLRSLVLLESRLTREQAQINLSLQQKEKIIKSQQEEINKLKARKSYCSNCQQLLGFTSEQTNIETDPEFQSLESTDSRFQSSFARSNSYRERNTPSVFQKNTRLSKSFQLPKNDVAYGNTSSSEEGNNSTSKGTFIKNKQVFVRRDVFRRSRKYSGRKQKYGDNMQKDLNTHANSSSAEECIAMSYQVNNVNDTTTNQIANDIRKASLKIDQLMDEANKKDNQKDSVGTFSTKIDKLHGIKRQHSDEINANRILFLNKVLNEENHDKPWYINGSDPEHESESFGEKKMNSNKKPVEDVVETTFRSEVLSNNSMILSAKNEILCNGAKTDISEGMPLSKLQEIKSNDSDLRKQNSSGEMNETWYASTSDAEDCPTNEIYKNNPVLECVNQILLQNSLDDSSNDNSKYSEAPSPKASTKRVQFSTLNSISYDDKVENSILNNTVPRSDKRANKIVKFSLETASEHSYEVPNTLQGFHYEIQSLYSNEYEPIITKNVERPAPLPRAPARIPTDIPHVRGSIVKNIAANIENRHNMEKERQLINDSIKIINKRKVPRTPPALPPKPKNLSSKWKAESNSANSPIDPVDSDAVAANQRVADVKLRKLGQVATVSTIEPDYCSISEINVPVVSNGKRELLLTQPTVEIHNEQYPVHTTNQRNNVAKVISIPRIQNKISDKDIPKLPQVTEIIIPDEDEKPVENCLNSSTFQHKSHHGNYLTNFNIPTLQQKIDARASIQMGNSVSSILSEINKGGKVCNKEINLTDLDNQFNHLTEKKYNPVVDINNLHKAEYFKSADNFDLSQNFEEFKIDDDLGSIVAEEYRISSGSSDGSVTDIINENNVPNNVPDKELQKNIGFNDMENAVNLKNDIKNPFLNVSTLNNAMANAKMSNKPDLLSNIENFETDSVRNSDIESSNSSGSNSGSYNTVKCEPGMVTKHSEINTNAVKPNKISFDIFLETTGLSSKSIITPTKLEKFGMRPPSANHKNVLKPKDVKMRVKNSITTNKINEKPMTTAIKYFEPYL